MSSGSSPKPIRLTIDGQPVEAFAGQTVLQAAQSVGIHIPSLCHHPLLKPIGACRVCLVEIEQQRTLQPACTFPAIDGLVVHTNSPKVLAARNMSLQLLFSERGHYCMICPVSGNAQTSDCELQRLGYECGMAHWDYPPDTSRRWPADTSHPYLMLDHSRCILCRRCVRACESIAANHTLGVHQRGARAMIGADDDVPLGDSSCVACGICIQVCPTGALTDRRSAYAGHDSQVQRTPSACTECSIGCGVELLSRDNHLLRIDGDLTASNEGLMCVTGRFESFGARDGADRILRPRIRQTGTPRAKSNGNRQAAYRDVSWDEALSAAASGLSKTQAAGLVSPKLSNESLAALALLFQEVLHSDELALVYGEAPPLNLGAPATLRDLAGADCIAIIGADPLDQHKVAGYFVKRAFDRGAAVIVVENEATRLDPYAQLRLQLEELAAHAPSPVQRPRHAYHLRVSGLNQLKAAIAPAQHPVILYGPGLSTTVYAVLRALPDRARFFPLAIGANAGGAAKLGLTSRPVQTAAILALIGDDRNASAAPLPPIDGAFLVVQAAYESPWTAAADVVLPARLWSEQSGHIVNAEGRVRELTAAIRPPADIPGDAGVLIELARRLGCQLPLDQVPAVLQEIAQGAAS